MSHSSRSGEAPPPAPSPPHDSVLALEVDTSLPPQGTSSPAGFGSLGPSLTSSVLDYEYENGRRYQGYRKGEYPLPNDEQEQDRLDLVHHIFLLILNGRLYESPIGPKPSRVLDVGTGTGIWAMDFADDHPDAEVVGTELSPIQPTWVPPNVKFFIDDAESEWVFNQDEVFDFVHVRCLSGSVRDWDKLMGQAYKHMQPGGWLEFQEIEAEVFSDDGSIEKAKHLSEWQKLCNDAAVQFKKPICCVDTFKRRMVAAGFVDVHERIVKIPLGQWPKNQKLKEIGMYHFENFAMAVDPYTYGFIGTILGWKEAECRVLNSKVMADVRNRDLHLYTQFWFVYGRKPEA